MYNQRENAQQYNNIAFFFMTGRTETEQKNTRVGWNVGEVMGGERRVYEAPMSLCVSVRGRGQLSVKCENKMDGCDVHV